MNPFQFQHPFTAVCAGPTGSGKTELVKQIIMHANEMICPAPEQIHWYYSESQPALYRSLGNVVNFREGKPDLMEYDGSKRTLLVLDDMMTECDTKVSDIFVKGSHHRNISIIFIVQNFFYKGGGDMRTITLNAQYLILFKNPRDVQQIRVLARQMYDRNSKTMEEAYKHATREPFGYLLVDLKQSTPDHLRLRSKIVPGQQLEIYTSKQFRDSVIVVGEDGSGSNHGGRR